MKQCLRHAHRRLPPWTSSLPVPSPHTLLLHGVSLPTPSEQWGVSRRHSRSDSAVTILAPLDELDVTAVRLVILHVTQLREELSQRAWRRLQIGQARRPVKREFPEGHAVL